MEECSPTTPSSTPDFKNLPAPKAATESPITVEKVWITLETLFGRLRIKRVIKRGGGL
jgi:hypothetical protein